MPLQATLERGHSVDRSVNNPESEISGEYMLVLGWDQEPSGKHKCSSPEWLDLGATDLARGKGEKGLFDGVSVYI